MKKVLLTNLYASINTSLKHSSHLFNTLTTYDGIPYRGKIWRALNLAKWRKKVVF